MGDQPPADYPVVMGLEGSPGHRLPDARRQSSTARAAGVNGQRRQWPLKDMP